MIEIINKQKRYWFSRTIFRDYLEKISHFYNLSDPVITLVFVTDREIKKLNLKFLKRDQATDVLSFPIREKAADGKYYLGDIVISVPTAFKQCLKNERGLEDELKILTLHGFLHLIGFDHGKGIEEEEQKIKNFLTERQK